MSIYLGEQRVGVYKDPSKDTFKAYLAYKGSCRALFENCTTLTSDQLSSFLSINSTTDITDFYNMFHNCSSLTTIPSISLNSATDTSSMFEGSGLVSYPSLSTFHVTNMNSMFNSCSNLKDAGQIDMTSNTNAAYMFYQCYNLTNVGIKNSGRVTTFKFCFGSCSSLETVPWFDTSKAILINAMFDGCSKIKTIPSFDCSSACTTQSMFYGCTSLESIPLLNIKKSTDVSFMFQNCSSLTEIPALDLSSVGGAVPTSEGERNGHMGSMFAGCSKLAKIHMKNIPLSFDISQTAVNTEEDLVEILNNLNTVTTTQTLTMGSTKLALLTDDDKKIATDKGWTLA